MVDLTQTFKHNDNILVQEVDGTVVLLSPEDGQYYALDEIGGRIWELCDDSRNVSDVIRLICAEYDAPPETIQADVLELVTELTNAKLLV